MTLIHNVGLKLLDDSGQMLLQHAIVADGREFREIPEKRRIRNVVKLESVQRKALRRSSKRNSMSEFQQPVKIAGDVGKRAACSKRAKKIRTDK